MRIPDTLIADAEALGLERMYADGKKVNVASVERDQR